LRCYYEITGDMDKRKSSQYFNVLRRDLGDMQNDDCGSMRRIVFAGVARRDRKRNVHIKNFIYFQKRYGSEIVHQANLTGEFSANTVSSAWNNWCTEKKRIR